MGLFDGEILVRFCECGNESSGFVNFLNIFGRVCKNCEKRLLASSCLSVCPSICPRGTSRHPLD